MSMPVLIYLAGPQDDVDQATARGWREQMFEDAPTGVAFYSPAHAYGNVNQASFPVVDYINRAVIREAHGLIANLSGEGRGFGTIREIEWAVQHGTIVRVVGPVGHSLMTWDIGVCDTLAQALDEILSQVGDKRERQAQHPLWKLLGGEQ